MKKQIRQAQIKPINLNNLESVREQIEIQEARKERIQKIKARG